MYTKLVLLTCLFGVLGSAYGAVEYTWYNYDIQALEWSGPNVVFMIALFNDNPTLFRSLDEGKTWIGQTQYLPGGTSHAVVAIRKDRVDEKKLIFLAAGLRTAWITSDSGANYTQITFPDYANGEISFNSKATGWFIVPTMCYDTFCNAFYVTRNFGVSFELVANKYVQLDWDHLPGAYETIVAIDTANNFAYTNDFGKSFNTLVKGAVDFAFTRKHLFVAVDDGGRNLKLYAASGNTINPASYSLTQYPFGADLPQASYTLLDDVTGAEWIGVVHNSMWGTVLSSDTSGTFYATSLQHAFHDSYMYFDFERFHGLEGIYIANNVTNFEQTTAKPLLTTVVTFDNGGEWKYLSPPTVDSQGNPIICTGKCSLHLHGLTSWVAGIYGPFYSTSNAIGLILATGNVGEYLDMSGTQINTYFSRDAGLTWNELMKGSHIYEFGDHGGIIVFADNKSPTNRVIYSLDEGLTLQTLELSHLVQVENIIIEPSGTGRKFILYGSQTVDGVSNGVVIGLDFTNAQPRICGDDDYETWNPTDGRANGQTCQLGRNVTYSRRKRDANCYNDRTTEHILSTVNCQCAFEDYECDFGYEETNVNGKSVCVLSTQNPPTYPPKDCKGTYSRSRGYRLVAGDSCVNELTELLPVTADCPPVTEEPTKHNTALIAVVIIFIVAAILGIGGFFVYRNEEWREKILDVVGKVIPIQRGPAYSRVGRHALAGDEEFGIGGDHDIDDVEDDAPVLEDTDIQKATSDKRDEFDPRS